MPDTNTDVFNDFVGKSQESGKPVKVQPGIFHFEDKQPRRVPMSIYLKPNVMAAVEKIAKKHGVSNSKVIEKILESSFHL